MNQSIRLKQARIAAGHKSARQFAGEVGVQYATYHSHETGTRKPPISALKIYAAALNVSVEHLLAGAAPGNVGGEYETHWAPVVSWASAGSFREAQPLENEPAVPVPSGSRTLVALRVDGDSMDREAAHNSLIVIDYSARQPVDGALVVARRGADTTFKRYRDGVGGPRLEPVSTNPAHEPLFSNGEPIEILGRVVYIVRSV